MPTLAQMVRAKHPGAYDDLSDQALEAAVRAKYPGQYDDLPLTPADDAQPQGSALGRFASNLGEMINPVTMVTGLAQAVAHPIATAGAMLGAQVDQGRQAIDLAKQGRYTEAAGHAGAAVLPVLGPIAAQAGEQIGAGDIAGGLGKATGILAPMAVGALAPRSLGVSASGRNLSQNAADAVAFGERAGIPLDAATATQNRAIGGLQHMSDRLLGGATVAEKAASAQQRGLATVGEQLAAKAHPTATTAEQAGQGISDAVLENVKTHAGDANVAYDKLRAIEADPAHTRTVYPDAPVPREGSAHAFAIHADASLDDLFEGAWRDAKKQGFKGNRGELRSAFADKVREAKSLRAESVSSAEEFGPEEFLRSVRELGGLKPFEKDYRPGAPAGKLTGEYENLTQLFANQKGASAIMRADGLELDDLLGQLRQDPRWDAMLGPDATTHDLKDLLEEIGRNKKHGTTTGAPTDIQHYLEGVGAKPGLPWWEEPKQPQTMQLPVDLRGVKASLKPIHDELMARYPVAQQEASKGLKALQNIVNGPDYAPLSTVDANLGAIKSIARTDLPELRSVSQGTAAGAVKQLDAVVRQTAADAGPEAIAALDAGRKATIAKYGAADVLDTLRDEPVKVHGQLTAPKDGAIAQLRTVAAQAPAEIPKIGRAVLDDLLQKATGDVSLFGHADAVASKWDRLGPETKRLLYKDPGYIKDLDDFFRLSRMIAKNANPSGTAHALGLGMQGAELLRAIFSGDVNGAMAVGGSVVGSAGLSKLFHSRAGVRLLTRGLRIPVGNRAAIAAWTGELSALTNPTGSQSQTLAPAQ